MNEKPFFSSVRHTWKTPKDLYVALNKEFNFDFDPCPTTPQFDGLSCSWKASNFINPPHKTQKLWIEKALEESQLENEEYLFLRVVLNKRVYLVQLNLMHVPCCCPVVLEGGSRLRVSRGECLSHSLTCQW